jgi:hypothetical protein
VGSAHRLRIAYNEIVFHLTKTSKRIQSDTLIKTSAGNTKKIRDAKAKQRPDLLDGDIDKLAQNTGYALDMADMERHLGALGKQGKTR